MNVGRVLGRLAARAAVTGLAVGYVGLAVAADTPVPVSPAVPVTVDPCPTCVAGPAGAPCGSAGCRSCSRLGHRAGCNPAKPVAGQLRPGACFGYFQTQWHRWEDVCPLPYQGVGANDVPQRAPVPGPLPIVPGSPRSDAPVPKTIPMAVPMGADKGGIPMAVPMGTEKGGLPPMTVPMGKGAIPSIPNVPPPPVVPNKFGM
jgi:hypothetical protein